MEELLSQENYICKSMIGLSKNCKSITGLLNSSVNFFYDESMKWNWGYNNNNIK